MKYLIADVFFVGVFCFGFERVYNFLTDGVGNLLSLPKYGRYLLEDLLLCRFYWPLANLVQTIFWRR